METIAYMTLLMQGHNNITSSKDQNYQMVSTSESMSPRWTLLDVKFLTLHFFWRSVLRLAYDTIRTSFCSFLYCLNGSITFVSLVFISNLVKNLSKGLIWCVPHLMIMIFRDAPDEPQPIIYWYFMTIFHML